MTGPQRVGVRRGVAVAGTTWAAVTTIVSPAELAVTAEPVAPPSPAPMGFDVCGIAP